MKHNFKKLLCISALALAVTMGATACGGGNNPDDPDKKPTAEKKVEGIVVTMTNDGIFSVGDTFEYEVMRIYKVFDDGSREIVATNDCTYDTPDLSTEGKRTMNVSYGDFETSFDYYVYTGITFNAAWSGAAANAPDVAWLVYNNGGRNSEGYRFADNNAYWTYKFTTDEGKRFVDANLSLLLSNEYLVSVSLDNQTWMEMVQGGTGSDRTENNNVSLNLKDDFMYFENNHGELYVKFSDANPQDGFGPILKSFNFYYASETDPNVDPKPPVDPAEKRTLNITSDGGADETKWLYANSNSKIWEGGDEGKWRYADETASWTYAFDFGQKLTSLKITPNLRFQQKIEISFDNATWTELANELAGGDWIDKDLSPELPESNTGKVYLRFSDAKTDDGFGVSVKSVAITYTVADDSAYTAPVPVEEEPVLSQIKFTPNTDSETPYLHHEVFSGTGEGHRWTDGDPNNAYVIYKFDKSAEGAFTTATLTLDIQNEYKLEISLDNQTWTDLAIAEGRPSRTQLELDLAQYLTGNTGVVYIKMSDSVTTDGFGADLYGVTLDFTLA